MAPLSSVPTTHSELPRPERERHSRPFLPPPPSRPENAGAQMSQTARAVSHQLAPSSFIHFDVHPGLDEVQALAREQGWFDRGFTTLTVPWVELVFTTDGWKTTRSLKSTEVPCPIVDGQFFLPDVPKGTEVEFALHVGIDCHEPTDPSGYRERGHVWLNNQSQNYRQTSR